MPWYGGSIQGEPINFVLAWRIRLCPCLSTVAASVPRRSWRVAFQSVSECVGHRLIIQKLRSELACVDVSAPLADQKTNMIHFCAVYCSGGLVLHHCHFDHELDPGNTLPGYTLHGFINTWVNQLPVCSQTTRMYPSKVRSRLIGGLASMGDIAKIEINQSPKSTHRETPRSQVVQVPNKSNKH